MAVPVTAVATATASAETAVPARNDYGKADRRRGSAASARIRKPGRVVLRIAISIEALRTGYRTAKAVALDEAPGAGVVHSARADTPGRSGLAVHPRIQTVVKSAPLHSGSARGYRTRLTDTSGEGCPSRPSAAALSQARRGGKHARSLGHPTRC